MEYSFDKTIISPTDKLSSESLILKLRRVIDDFELIGEEEYKEIVMKVAEVTSSYPEELQNAFEAIKNGEETVSKKDMH